MTTWQHDNMSNYVFLIAYDNMITWQHDNMTTILQHDNMTTHDKAWCTWTGSMTNMMAWWHECDNMTTWPAWATWQHDILDQQWQHDANMINAMMKAFSPAATTMIAWSHERNMITRCLYDQHDVWWRCIGSMTSMSKRELDMTAYEQAWQRA
jgi:hypothetical protein